MVKNKKLIVLILQLALMGVFVMGTYTFSQKELKLTTVYQFAKKMNANAEIEISDLKKVSIPESAVGKGFLTEKEYKEIENGNKVVATKVEAGQYVYSNQIINSDKVDPFEKIDLSKYRKITIPVSYATAVSGEISKGDRVDLAFRGELEGENGGDATYSTVFMQDVLVYSVNTGDGFEYVEHTQVKKSQMNSTDGSEETGISSVDYENPIALITLAVPMHDVEEIIARVGLGEITVLGRFDTSVDTDAPGFYLGPNQDTSVIAVNKEVEK